MRRYARIKKGNRGDLIGVCKGKTVFFPRDQSKLFDGDEVYFKVMKESKRSIDARFDYFKEKAPERDVQEVIEVFQCTTSTNGYEKYRKKYMTEDKNEGAVLVPGAKKKKQYGAITIRIEGE